MATEFKNPLKRIISLTILTFLVLLVLYVLIKCIPSSIIDADIKKDITSKIEYIANIAWNFLSPILQVTLILIILEWVLQKFGTSVVSVRGSLNWNVQTVIAILVVGTFALASLTNLSKGLDYLKDLSLVVVGFYFGTQKRIVETKDNDKEIKITEEYSNQSKAT